MLPTPEPPDRLGQILFTDHDPAKVSRGIDDPSLHVLREPQFDDQVVANTVDREHGTRKWQEIAPGRLPRFTREEPVEPRRITSLRRRPDPPGAA